MGKELVHSKNLLPLACSARRALRTKLMAPPDNKMDVTAEDDSKKGEAMGMMVLSNGKWSQ